MTTAQATDARPAMPFVVWQKGWRFRLALSLLTAAVSLSVLPMMTVATWLCGCLALQAGETLLVAYANRAHFGARRRMVSKTAILLANALVYHALGILMLLQGGAVSGVLAYCLTISMLFGGVVPSEGSRTYFLAAASPSVIALCLVYPPAMAQGDGLMMSTTLALAGVGVAATVLACGTFAVFSDLIASEVAARRRAEAATEARERFLATVSHELRTPLSGIVAGASELTRRLDAGSDLRQAQLIVDAGAMMRTLVDDLLDMAKLEAGELRVTAAPFAVRKLLATTAAFWRADARKRGVRLRVEGARNVPPNLIGDATRLRQILNNLISNALKFTAEGVVTLELDYAAGVLTLSVRDTGKGMTAEQVQRLFRRFAQADETIASTFGGTGLGLSISQELAQAMGGAIEVSSTPNVGSCFTVRLPLMVSDAPQTAASHDDDEAPAPLAGLRVLAADDHEINRRVLALMLEPLGVQLTLVVDGAAALAQLEAQPFDLLLVDVHMPGLSGYEVARALRASTGPNASVPIVAVTGAVEESDASSRLAAGIDAVVAKPVEAEALLATLSNLSSGVGARRVA